MVRPRQRPVRSRQCTVRGAPPTVRGARCADVMVLCSLSSPTVRDVQCDSDRARCVVHPRPRVVRSGCARRVPDRVRCAVRGATVRGAGCVPDRGWCDMRGVSVTLRGARCVVRPCAVHGASPTVRGHFCQSHPSIASLQSRPSIGINTRSRLPKHFLS